MEAGSIFFNEEYEIIPSMRASCREHWKRTLYMESTENMSRWQDRREAVLKQQDVFVQY